MTCLSARTIRALAVAAAAGISAHAVLAEEVDFGGERIEVVITSSEGGGADTYARFIGGSLKEELPGKPTMIYRNMPGGGGLIANNWFEANGTSDGRIILSMTSSSILRPVFGDPTEYDFDASHWIPVVASPNGYVAIGSKISDTLTIESALAQDRAQTMGMANVLGAGTMFLLSYDMLGLETRPAFNVPGSDSQLSFERGEFTMEASSTGSFARLSGPEVEKGNIAPLFVFGSRMPDGSIVRDASLPDVPTFPEVYERIHGEPPSGPAWTAWNALFDAVCTNAKAYMLSEGTPDEIVQTYREAARKALTNPELMETQSYLNVLGSTPQFFGEDARKSAEAAVAQLNPEVVRWLKDWHMEKFGVPLQ